MTRRRRLTPRHAGRLPSPPAGWGRGSVVLGVAAALLALALVACSGGNPELVLERTAVDLGQIVNGEIRTFEVPIANAGDGPLVIEAVTTSCGCTSATVVPATILPGESGLLRIRFDSGAHGSEEKGPVMRQVFIASNDPNRPEVELRFEANVMPPG